MKNRLMHAMLAFSVVAFSSCEKNDDLEVAQPELTQGSISHIMADSVEVTSFNYQGNLLSQSNHYNKETGEVETYDLFEYNSNGQLTKASSYSGSNNALLSEQDYTYNESGLLTKSNSSYYNGSSLVYSSYATYAYNADNKLEQKSVYEVEESKEGEEESKLKSYTTFETLPNGNYGTEQQFVMDANNEAKLFSTTTYTYDSNINPLYSYSEPGTAISPNNVVASTVEVHGINKTYNYTFSYMYDERGYPVSQTTTAADGKSETYTYLYSN
ncbi:hypothetical protein ACFSKU_00320 [Pontibacter silvestris]|uniref:YD repeat-containing protein n=1 Tax=Pontibacter silvestris TaxID=2305183 RepID=A0ABW4WT20_9BACT|nr:hypothetical protein [Pontibacter silvestris]MCC9138192.1 hypothetical protein [Pontibacter silvestris]